MPTAHCRKTRQKHRYLRSQVPWRTRKLQEPVRDGLVVLSSLLPNYGSKTERTICVERDGSHCIRFQTFNGGYAGIELSQELTVPITTRAFEYLRTHGYISGRPEWGYTSDTDFILTREGARRVHEFSTR